MDPTSLRLPADLGIEILPRCQAYPEAETPGDACAKEGCFRRLASCMAPNTAHVCVDVPALRSHHRPERVKGKGVALRKFRSALAIALALASAQAAALGLGQIEVRSRINEPLLAEIPVIYSDPAELEQLQARLASPETFARVGLDPPQGTVADLQFAVALDASGNTVIRVTSSQPVNTSLLVFLVEVDSGQSRWCASTRP